MVLGERQPRSLAFGAALSLWQLFIDVECGHPDRRLFFHFAHDGAFVRRKLHSRRSENSKISQM